MSCQIKLHTKTGRQILALIIPGYLNCILFDSSFMSHTNGSLITFLEAKECKPPQCNPPLHPHPSKNVDNIQSLDARYISSTIMQFQEHCPFKSARNKIGLKLRNLNLSIQLLLNRSLRKTDIIFQNSNQSLYYNTPYHINQAKMEMKVFCKLPTIFE